MAAEAFGSKKAMRKLITALIPASSVPLSLPRQHEKTLTKGIASGIPLLVEEPRFHRSGASVGRVALESRRRGFISGGHCTSCIGNPLPAVADVSGYTLG